MHLCTAYCHKLKIIKLLSHVLFRLVLVKEKLKILVTSSELYLVFGSIYSIQGIEKNQFSFIVDRGLK